MTISFTNGASIYNPTKSEFDSDWNYQHVLESRSADNKAWLADGADIATLLDTDLWTLFFAVAPNVPDVDATNFYLMGGSSTGKIRIRMDRLLISGSDYQNSWRFQKFDNAGGSVTMVVTEVSFFSTAETHAARNARKYICARSDTTNGIEVFVNDILNTASSATWNSAASTISGSTYWMNWTVAASNGWQGKVGDWYFYDRKLTDAEVTEVLDNYKVRYGSVQE